MITDDSGRPLFPKYGDPWKLAGLGASVTSYTNQPGGASSALYGIRAGLPT